MKSSALCLTFFLLYLMLLAGCAPSAVKEDERFSADLKPLIWPLPPEPARITYLRTIEEPDDVGAKKGLFRRLAEFVLGPKEDRIIRPFGIAVDGSGRILVSDTALKRVHVFDVKKKKYSFFTKAGKVNLDSPMGIAVDANDNIYVSDSMRGRVFVYNKKAKFLFDIKGLVRPSGLALNKNERLLYAVDTGAHDIKVFDLEGNQLNTIGTQGNKSAEFNYPVDIFVNKKGDLYVTDSMNFRVQILDKFGNFITMFGRHGDGTGDMGRPKGLAVDRDGNVYVVDAIFDTVQIFDKSGNFLLNFGTIGREPGKFWLPSGLFIDDDDKIYVADSYNRRVQVFEYLGN